MWVFLFCLYSRQVGDVKWCTVLMKILVEFLQPTVYEALWSEGDDGCGQRSEFWYLELLPRQSALVSASRSCIQEHELVTN